MRRGRRSPGWIGGVCRDLWRGFLGWPRATMTRLGRWISALGVLTLVWLGLVQDVLSLGYPKQLRDVLVPLPAYLLVTAGSYVLGTLGLRVANFNDCEEAAQELFLQIKEAQADLASKGLVL